MHVQDAAYYDSAYWAEVAADRALFDESFEAARTSDVLLTHLAEDNRFIVLLAYKPERVPIEKVTPAIFESMRPLEKKRYGLIYKKAKAEPRPAVR